MDYHVTANLSAVETIIPYFQQTDRLIGDDVEDKDVERMVAGIHQKPFEPVLSFVNPSADVEGHQEAENGRNGEREKLVEGGTPVHIGGQVFREEEDDNAEEQGGPDIGIVPGNQTTIVVDVLSENKAHTEEETTHQVAIAALHEIDDLQPFPCFPAAE